MSKEKIIKHDIKLYPQPTGWTCWSAATSMLFSSNLSAGPGRAALGLFDELLDDFDNIQAFAGSYRLRLYAPQSWTATGLLNLLKKGPIAMMGAMPSAHAVVIAGIKSDETEKGTVLTVYDPWPPNIGEIYEMNYLDWVVEFPLLTYYLLQK